jgi:hypothetical protein
LNNTATTTYTFTPTAGQCATTATLTITVNPNITTTGGCTGTATYNYNPQTVASSYTILGIDGVTLNKTNTVQNGSLGATSSSGTINIGNNSSVASPGAFVKAKNLNISGSANVPVQISSPAVVTLPAMQYNTTNTDALNNVTVSNNTTGTLSGNYRNLTIWTNCNITLTGTIFRLITIKAGSTVRFSQPVVNVSGINLQQGTTTTTTTLAFSQATIVKSNGDINVATRCSVNPDGYKTGCGKMVISATFHKKITV